MGKDEKKAGKGTKGLNIGGKYGKMDGDHAAQAAHSAIGSGSYSKEHHDAVNYNIPPGLAEELTRNKKDGEFKHHHTAQNNIHASGGGMGGLGGTVQRRHDRMLVANTRIGKGVYRNAILLNLKEVRLFFSIWNICFLTIVSVLCTLFAFANPEERMKIDAVPNTICFDDSDPMTCSNHVHCWDNKYLESPVFMPVGYYPVQRVAEAQDQPWDGDKAAYQNVTGMMDRWYMIGFILSLLNLGKEIYYLCVWEEMKDLDDDIYTTEAYNRIEFKLAVKQFQDAVGFIVRSCWFIWGAFIFWSKRTLGCRGGYHDETPNNVHGYLEGATWGYWICLGLYVLRPFVFTLYSCIRQKDIRKKYDKIAYHFKVPSAETEYKIRYERTNAFLKKGKK